MNSDGPDATVSRHRRNSSGKGMLQCGKACDDKRVLSWQNPPAASGRVAVAAC